MGLDYCPLGESHSCLPVLLLNPLNIAAVEQPFDITIAHLYVTPNFAHLSVVLICRYAFASLWGNNRGSKANPFRTIGTVELIVGFKIQVALQK